MDMPGLIDTLEGFARMPPRWLYDGKIYRESWKWALEAGQYPPMATFSCDDLPVLCFMAVHQDDDEGCVFETFSGIVLL